MHRHLLLLLIAAAAAPAPAQRTSCSVTVGTEQLTLEWTPTSLRGRTAARELRPGTVWRMSKDEPPLLTTPVPLLVDGVVLAPGAIRLSARYIGEKLWSMVLFRDASLFHEQLAYDEVPVALHEEPVAQEMLELSLQQADGAVVLALRWGRYSLRQQLQPLAQTSASGVLLGAPALFTFYGVPATDAVVRRLHEGWIRIGDVQQTGGAGIRYALDVRLDPQAQLWLRLQDLLARQQQRDERLDRQELARLEQMLATAEGERRDRIAARIETVRSRLARLAQAQQARAGLAPELELEGTPVAGTPAQALSLTASARTEGEATRIVVGLGQQAAEFVLGPDALRAHQGGR